MSEFGISVRTELSASMYRRLHVLAESHHVTVGALVAELVLRQLTPKHHGRKSGYTSVVGEQIFESRRFHRSFAEAGHEVGVSASTAKRYLGLYVAQLRREEESQQRWIVPYGAGSRGEMSKEITPELTVDELAKIARFGLDKPEES